MPPSPSLAVTK